MEIFIAILALVWSILCLILFFKIWGMTNDVKEILYHFRTAFPVGIEKNNTLDEGEILVGDFPQNSLVVENATGKQMRIKSLTPEGKYSCYINQGATYYGDFYKDEITLFEDYVKNKK